MSTTIVRASADPDHFELVDPAIETGPVQLLASYSPAADEYFWPRRRRCPLTAGAVEDVTLEARGTLWSWTYVHLPWPAEMSPSGGDGYGVGLVDLPEGPRVFGLLLGGDGDWEIGDEMVGAAFDFAERDGALICLLAFRRVEAS